MAHWVVVPVVIPACAGLDYVKHWIPACAGMTARGGFLGGLFQTPLYHDSAELAERPKSL